jgi:hypothetical protein
MKIYVASKEEKPKLFHTRAPSGTFMPIPLKLYKPVMTKLIEEEFDG